MSVPPLARFIFPVLVAMSLSSTRAEIIFDNSGPGDASLAWWSLANYSEFGDEITLGGTNRVLTQFQFEYYGDFKATGDEKARIRIYKNDGPGETPTPGTVLFDSGMFNIMPDWQTWTSGALNVPLPDSLTWTVQFSGLTGVKPASGVAGDRSGIVFRNPPSVGSSYNDAWVKTAAGWQTVVWGEGGPIANFAARLISDPSRVSIARKPNTVVLEWTGASILQESSNISGPFIDIPAARNRYEIPIRANAAIKFWRLRD